MNDTVVKYHFFALLTIFNVHFLQPLFSTGNWPLK